MEGLIPGTDGVAVPCPNFSDINAANQSIDWNMRLKLSDIEMMCRLGKRNLVSSKERTQLSVL
jgi:hypothetical protein